MKQLIVACCVLILLIAFPLQTLLDNSNTAKITLCDKIVRSYAEQASKEGYFTPEIINEMIAELDQKIKGLDAGDIIIECTTTPKYRTIDYYDERELITYSVTIPIKNAFIGGVVFSNEENRTHTCQGSVTSERLP